MRKIICFLIAAMLVFSLAVTVSATEASSMSTTVSVNSDGSCHISLSLTLLCDGSSDKVYFPLPAGASGIRVNGSRVMASKDDDVLNVNLTKFTKGVSGNVSVNIQYDLHGLVAETELGTLELRLPLLSGFNYPVAALDFAVTLPGETEALPAFSSGYHQASIEQHLSYTLEGATIKGSSLKSIKDHETLVMTLPVDNTMFSRVVVQTESALIAWIGMGVCAGLALLYWLLFLRFVPLRKHYTEAPDGFNAGQVRSVLGSGGTDLTMLVFSWAQLGYVLIEPQRGGKVLLHKRMDMGNERSDMEQICFRKLFGARQSVDASGARYGTLAGELAAKSMGVGELYHKRSGNPKVFRFLLTGVGLFAGGGIGAVLGNGAALQWFLIVLMAALGGLSGYMILGWTDSGLLRSKRSWIGGVGLAAVWAGLALAAGIGPMGIVMALGLLIFGILYGWSGRRTEFGRYTAGQFLGLRHYLRGGDKAQLRRACELDPDYFFRMLPLAVALGADKAFAKAVGREKLDRCPYLLQSNNQVPLTPLQWQERIRGLVSACDARMENRYLEKLIKFIARIIRR
ncbi:MAG: DUF2207 domain-containing protein [Oscillospiraceae bacterium]|nr:DUF2207 domain-containing protein [Oscillospiraceae bacterium]